MRRIVGILLVLTAWCAAQDETAEYAKALRLQSKKKWVSAQKAFRRFLRDHPESPLAKGAANRSNDNCYLGTEMLWKGGPPANRVDLAVMGDGFTVDSASQRKQEKWAKLCIDVLWNEKGLSQYRSYFNVYFVRLGSLEEGVDPQLSPDQLRKIQEKNRGRSKSRQKKTNFSTALEAKAAGPQGQVVMDRKLVYKWLDIADGDIKGAGDDRYVIAFAQFGKLGMGGGGIANVGRPDKSVTTHEFGHAFSRLRDEYANNPNAPRGMYAKTLNSPNSWVSDKEPKPSEVPWAHWLKKRAKGVGIHEGGATFKKGVWRPARGCAMNAAGNNAFCPICREQTILVIYEHVSPIDDAQPAPSQEIEMTEGDKRFLTVVPMEPHKHKLNVDWYVVDHVTTKSEHGEEFEEIQPAAPPQDPQRPRMMFTMGGKRAKQDRSMYNNAPSGKRVTKLAKRIRGKGRGDKRTPTRSVFPLAKLGVGTWRITAQVEDRTKFVLKDEMHLLQQRTTWTVTVHPTKP